MPVRVVSGPAMPMDELPPVNHPLEHETLQRRIRALYVSKGYTRMSFAKATGIGYNVICTWDSEAHVPLLRQLVRVSTVLDVSLDDLVHGRKGRPAYSPGPVADEVVREVLDGMRATPAQRAAVGEHLSSPVARYQQVTREYVQRYAQVYGDQLTAGATTKRAADVAFAEAVNMRALTAAATAPAPTVNGSNASPKRERGTRARKRTPPPRRGPDTRS